MFKKLIQSAVAASLIATPLIAATAEAQTRSVTTVKQRPNGAVVRKTTTVRTPARVTNRAVANRAVANRVAARQWRKGQQFDRRQARNYAQLDYRRYRARQLYAPPRGYQWVRSGNDAILIGATSGVIAAVLANALR